MEIFYLNKESHRIGGYVYCAGCGEDSQGDRVDDVAVLQAACLAFNKRAEAGEAMFNISHEEGSEIDLKIIESFVTEKEEMRNGKELAAECWYLELEVPDELFKKIQDGSLEGFSVQGTGQGEDI